MQVWCLTWLVRAIDTVAKVVVHPIEGDRSAVVQANEASTLRLVMLSKSWIQALDAELRGVRPADARSQ